MDSLKRALRDEIPSYVLGDLFQQSKLQTFRKIYFTSKQMKFTAFTDIGFLEQGFVRIETCWFL